jgi:hypothetical protein
LRWIKSGQAFEGRGLGLVVQKICDGDRTAAAFARTRYGFIPTSKYVGLLLNFFPERDEPAGVGDRQVAQHDSIDNAKNSGIEADAQGDGKHGNGGESRRLAQRAAGKYEILGEVVQPVKGPHFAALLGNLGLIAKLTAGGSHGLRRGAATR